MTIRRTHPDSTELLEHVGCGRGTAARATGEHSLACVACTRALEDLIQIGAALFEDLAPYEVTPASRARAMEAAGVRRPRSTRARARAASAARGGPA